jgi:pyrroloquinoline quinone biosynthesis protein E
VNAVDPPLALLAELTHRCPLQCPYCSNPLKLERASDELDTGIWLRVLREAADIGCMQVHFSGGEPTARRDLEALVNAASQAGLYTNLITSGVLLDPARIRRLVDAGLEHIQLSFQDTGTEGGDFIGGYPGGHAKKIEVARFVRESGLPLTANFVVHRRNLCNLPKMLDMAVSLRAHRVEIAHVQYYGWALRNRAALLPSRAQVDQASNIVDEARERLKGTLVIDYVVPDYYAYRPKSCMGGWGRRFLTITPSGKVLPCHAAETIVDLKFDTVDQYSLAHIWKNSDAFNRFRGTNWMPQPCASCDRAEIDWGGCRCQALALTGDAGRTDPACALSPDHGLLVAATAEDATMAERPYLYRGYANSPL